MDDLVSKARKGDRTALERLLELQSQPLFRLCQRLLGDRGEAEEAVQEALVRIFTRLRQLEDPARFRPWCATLTANLCRDRLRGRKPPTLPEEALWSLAGGEQPAEVVASAEVRGVLREALATLSERLRLVILLRDVDGLSGDEVAAALRIPEGTVKSRLHEARRQLRSVLTREGERSPR